MGSSIILNTERLNYCLVIFWSFRSRLQSWNCISWRSILCNWWGLRASSSVCAGYSDVAVTGSSDKAIPPVFNCFSSHCIVCLEPFSIRWCREFNYFSACLNYWWLAGQVLSSFRRGWSESLHRSLAAAP